LVFLEKHLPLVEQRDDLCVERITLYNQLGEYEKARELIAGRKFHPWEGGEGKITGQFILCRVELAKQWIKKKMYANTLQLLQETEVYPHNLGEGKLINAEENDMDYYKGVAYRALGEESKARSSFNKLIAYGEKHLFDICKIDYFAVSLPDLAIWEDDLNIRNRIHCHYMMGLGYLGLNDKKKAQEFLGKVYRTDINHQGGQVHFSESQQSRHFD
jgi:tetratricopeptide (TPR) repeat protein